MKYQRRKRNPHSKECDDEKLRILFDRGNPRWLEEQRSTCKEAGMRLTHNGTYVPARFGPTTAYISRENRAALFPVEFINAKGLSGEEQRFRTSDLKWLMNYMGTHHRLPPINDSKPDHQYFPFIQVWIDGSWWINEGNHRIESARRLGWKYMPLVIRWHSGGEDHHSAWGHTPGVVERWDRQAHLAGYCIDGFRAFP
jgi:hypothetical protein